MLILDLNIHVVYYMFEIIQHHHRIEVSLSHYLSSQFRLHIPYVIHVFYL